MKKQKLQIISAVAAVALLSQTAVLAFGGTYPVHTDIANYEEHKSSTKDCWTPTDSKYTFKVGGKSFILLDTDSEGNYFVMTDDEYGKHAFDTTYDRSPAIETRVLVEGKYEYTTGTAASMDDTQWMYNPEDTDNIGHWLNNDFLQSGNGSTYVLPDEIKNNLIEKTWTVENYKPVKSWTVGANYTDADNTGIAHVDAFLASRGRASYTVGGKLSLMSYTEYLKYQDIIGVMFCDKGWNGFMLRTPYSLTVASDALKTTYAFGGMQVRNQSTAVDTSKKMLIVGNDSPATVDYFYVRPVMWLSKDFFKNVKCDISSLGSYPKTEVLNNSEAGLKAAGYTDSDISTLLGFTKSWDWGHYPTHPSDVKILTRIAVSTGVDKGASNAANLFTIGGRRFILLDRNMNGEYFVMADEEYGQRGLYTTAYTNTLPTSKKDWLPAHWLFNPAVTDSMAYTMNSTQYGLLSNDTKYALKYVTPGYTGDITSKLIPQAMVDDLIEKTWEVEPFYPDYSWKVDGIPYSQYAANDTISETAKNQILSWQANILANSSKTTVKAKLTYPSYTEIQSYKNKIGFSNYVTTAAYAGTLLRTPYAMVDAPDKVNGVLNDSWSVAPGFITVLVKAADAKPQFSYASATDDKYMIRPVMWLKPDFFKNNKIDATTAGATVKAEMHDLYSVEDLTSNYTLSEISKLGYDVDKVTNLTYKSAGADITDLATISDITVSANVTNVGNANETMIVAVYKDGKLAGVNFQDFTFSSENSLPAEVTINGLAGADACKVMLWTGLTGEGALKPIYNTSF